MLGISLLRVLRNALLNFQRNIWLSLATTIIMTLTLLIVSFLFFLNVLGSEILKSIEQKVDLSAVFKDTVTEDQIQFVAQDIRARPDVKEVRIIDNKQALEIFRNRHEDDPFIEESLKELQENPLPASIFIVATEPRFYERIAQKLQSSEYEHFIDKVNFENSRVVIDRLIAVMSGVRNVGFAATATFAGLVILIMFNTIRLAIYSFREEIDIMRLVGASGWFIRGPFVIEAMLVALLSVTLSTLTIFPALKAVAPHVDQFFFKGQDATFDIYTYAVSHWATVIGMQTALAICLAVVSSMIAIRRYLR